MAEPFSPPSKEYVKKALALYKDPIICFATNTAIKTLNEMSENPENYKKYEKFQKRRFYRMCRLMILNFGCSTPFQILENASYDVANEQWSNFEIPKEEMRYKYNSIKKEWSSG